MSHSIVKTYEEANSVVERLGILPLSRSLPGHPSLDSITEPASSHTGTDTDPRLWRDRFAAEGRAAYGRFLDARPILIARGVFPLVKCVLASPQTPQERYAAGLLTRGPSRSIRAYPAAPQHRGPSAQKGGGYAGQSEQTGL